MISGQMVFRNKHKQNGQEGLLQVAPQSTETLANRSSPRSSQFENQAKFFVCLFLSLHLSLGSFSAHPLYLLLPLPLALLVFELVIQT